MQFVVLASLFAAAMASPAMVARTGGVCQNGLYTNFQCCSVNALNILALDCSIPGERAGNMEDAQKICAKTGASALCCVVPIADQALLCTGAI